MKTSLELTQCDDGHEMTDDWTLFCNQISVEMMMTELKLPGSHTNNHQTTREVNNTSENHSNGLKTHSLSWVRLANRNAQRSCRRQWNKMFPGQQSSRSKHNASDHIINKLHVEASSTSCENPKGHNDNQCCYQQVTIDWGGRSSQTLRCLM